VIYEIDLNSFIVFSVTIISFIYLPGCHVESSATENHIYIDFRNEVSEFQSTAVKTSTILVIDYFRVRVWTANIAVLSHESAATSLPLYYTSKLQMRFNTSKRSSTYNVIPEPRKDWMRLRCKKILQTAEPVPTSI